MSFEIVLPLQNEFALEASGNVLDRVNDLVKQIFEKAVDLLRDNLPDWPVVEAAVELAYNTYVRPLSIPNFIDNLILKALLEKVKEFYNKLD